MLVIMLRPASCVVKLSVLTQVQLNLPGIENLAVDPGWTI